jgi:hypothetical protein
MTDKMLAAGQAGEWARQRKLHNLPDDFKISLFDDEDVAAEKDMKVFG